MKELKNRIKTLKQITKKAVNSLIATSILLSPITITPKFNIYKPDIEKPTKVFNMEIKKLYGYEDNKIDIGWYNKIFSVVGKTEDGEEIVNLNGDTLKLYYYNYLNNDKYYKKIHEELDKNGNGYIDEQELKDLILEKLDKGEAEFKTFMGDWIVDVTFEDYNGLGVSIGIGRHVVEKQKYRSPLRYVQVDIAFGRKYMKIELDRSDQSLSSLMEEYENIYGEEFQYPSSFDVKVNGIEPYKERFIKLAALIVEKYLSTVKLWIKIYQHRDTGHRETGSYLFSAFVKAPNLSEPDKGKYTYIAYTYVEPQDDIALQLKAEWDDNRELEPLILFPMGYVKKGDERWIGAFVYGKVKDEGSKFRMVTAYELVDFDPKEGKFIQGGVEMPKKIPKPKIDFLPVAQK